MEHSSFSGNRYGTSKQTVEDQAEKDLVAILEVEMEGVKQLKANLSNDARFVFVRPPSFQALEARLRSRGTEDSTRKRLNHAKTELEYAQTTNVHDQIIVNGDLERAYEEFREFLYKAVSGQQIIWTMVILCECRNVTG